MATGKKRRSRTAGNVLVFVLLAACLATLGLVVRQYLVLAAEEAAPVQGTPGQTASGSSQTGTPQERSLEEVLADTVFVGDSRTNRMKAYGILAQEQVYAVDGMSHHTALTQRFVTLPGSREALTIAEAVEKTKPARIVVAFGINGVAFMSESGFFEEYEALLRALRTASPDSLLIVQAILPVSAEYAEDDPRMANSKIDAYNERLRQCTEALGGRFLDASSALKDENGDLAQEYDAGDGLHFNREAYDALLAYYEAHLDVFY